MFVCSLECDHGKLRSALSVESNLLAELESLVICPITSAVRDAALRITVEPDNANGLRVLSQVMVDKLSTLPRSKISKPFGRLDDERMKAVDRALLLVVGRSEEHTSELQSLMRISFAVFC